MRKCQNKFDIKLIDSWQGGMGWRLGEKAKGVSQEENETHGHRKAVR